MAYYLSIPGYLPIRSYSHRTVHVRLSPLLPRPPYKSPLSLPPLVFIAEVSDPISPSQRMNSFDSTFEALSLHYVGFGLFTVVNNVWTLVALVTAALSFWRLRGASLPVQLPSDRRLASSPERESTSAAIDSRPWSSIPDTAEETTTAAVSAETVIPPSPKIATAPSAWGGDGVTKGKFVMYYREDDSCDEALLADEEVEQSGGRMCGGGGGAGEWWEGWEKALRIRSNGVENGTGWYDYQDLAVLSGSVVRLWEEERRRGGGGRW